jgi:dipeptidyl aminopeptidase/acylaminoacyl peptidase
MKNYSIYFSVMFAFHAWGQTNSHLVSRERVSYPSYETIDRIGGYYDKHEYLEAINDDKITVEKIIYFSDSLKVVAYYAAPSHPWSEKLPVIIFNRGSYVRNDIAFVYAPFFKKLVDNGFIVLAPAFRESEGGEGKDELGGRDVNDIMNLLPLLSNLELADRKSIFMYGESRGGIMTYLAAKNGFPMKAAATVGAITDLERYMKDNPDEERSSHKIWPDYTTHQSKIWADRSAILWADKINVPVLIMNGAKDRQVKPYHSISLAIRLLELGKPCQLVILEGGNHRLSLSSSTERDDMIITWFRKFL